MVGLGTGDWVVQASSAQRVGDRAVLAAAGSVRPQHAAGGRRSQRAAKRCSLWR